MSEAPGRPLTPDEYAAQYARTQGAAGAGAPTSAPAPGPDPEAAQAALDATAIAALQAAGASPATIKAVQYQQEQNREKRRKIAAGEIGSKPMDRYYAVKTGDTADSIAKDLGHEGQGADLLNAKHPGGPANGELIAGHLNLVSGANGEATDGNGRLLIPVTTDQITVKTKLVEGQSFLLPEGW
jgi:hypothetical protein